MTDFPPTLAIDYGTVRLGLAISDPLGITAQPLEAVAMGDHGDPAPAIARITALVTERRIVRIVLGLPRTLSGTIGDAAQATRKFGEQLKTALLKLPIACELIEWDERLTSVIANQALREIGKGAKARKQAAKNGVVDVMAAQLILQSFLDRHAQIRERSTASDSSTLDS